MRKIIKWIAIVLGILLIAGFAIGYTPDTDPAAMRAKYGGAPSRFLDIGGGLTVHVRDTGPRDAPAIMLIHGANASLHTWDGWAQRLGKRFRVVRLDLPGHGLTGPATRSDYSPTVMADVVERLRARLRIEQMAVVGSSMGGGVAWHYALAHPDRVTALVLADSVGQPPSSQSDTPLVFRLARLPVLRDLARVITPRSLVESGLYGAFHDPRRVTPAMIDRSWELLRYPGNRRAMVERFGAPADVATPAALASLKMPVLIMWGADDRMIPLSSARWLKAHVPGSRLIIYPSVGHALMEEVPDRSAADAAAFLESVK